MTTRRVVIVATCVLVAALAVVLALVTWDHVNRIATVVSVLAAVASLGVGVWAGIPGARSARAQLTNSGVATADGVGSSANTGVSGPALLDGPIVVDGSGDAKASAGGTANSGVQLS